MIIVIDNLDFDYHFEIIESIIQKYERIKFLCSKYQFNKLITFLNGISSNY